MNVSEVLARLDTAPLADVDPVYLAVGPVRLRILCAEPLRSELTKYFAEALAKPGAVDASILVLEGQKLEPAPQWSDWARDPGKTGRKDAVHDLCDGRLVHKVRTGMTFLQSARGLVAFGPCAANLNQIVNFLNTQVLNICLRDGWQLCHAAAVTNGKHGLAIAGLSGGGKSTSILRILDLPGTAFVTNDRLLVQPGQAMPRALGIPKQPRINPGTILHNSRLHPILSAARLAELAEMPPDDLWQLEEKYDLIVSDIYGLGRVQYDAPLTDFWVLNWDRDSHEPARLSEVDLVERPDLLSAIMKSPGPFYANVSGEFLKNAEALHARGYLDALARVRVKEVTGGVDFDVIYKGAAEIL